MLTRTPIVLALSLVANCASAQWVKPPSPEQLESTPGLVHETFESSAMKTTLGYSVVLPPSYGRQRLAEVSIKYPEMFCPAVAYGEVRLTWSTRNATSC